MSLGAAWSVLGAVALLGCARPVPRAIAYGQEPCRHCHMTIADPRFAAGTWLTWDRIPAGGHDG